MSDEVPFATASAPRAIEAPAPEPAQVSAPEPEKVKLADMLWFCNDEADRIESVERARAAAGDAPLQERLRRAEVARATARFLFAVEPHLEEVRAIIIRRAKRGSKK